MVNKSATFKTREEMLEQLCREMFQEARHHFYEIEAGASYSEQQWIDAYTKRMQYLGLQEKK